jgi:hypothetical protein
MLGTLAAVCVGTLSDVTCCVLVWYAALFLFLRLFRGKWGPVYMGNALSLEGFLALRQLPLPPSHISAAVCIRIGALPASFGALLFLLGFLLQGLFAQT